MSRWVFEGEEGDNEEHPRCSKNKCAEFCTAVVFVYTGKGRWEKFAFCHNHILDMVRLGHFLDKEAGVAEE